MTENNSQPVDPQRKRRKPGNGGHPREVYLPMLAKARAAKKLKKQERQLTPDDELFLQAYLTNGNNAAQAERTCFGTRDEKASIRGHYRLKHEAVRRRLMELSKMLQKETVYTVEKGMSDLTLNLDLAVALGQMNAAARFLELKLKLAGHLIDRTQIEITRVDLKGILDDAKARAARVADAEDAVIVGESPFG